MRRGLTVAVVLLFSTACSLKFEASLVKPWNRDVDAASGERALVAKARYLLLAGLTDEQVVQNLQDQGLTAEEARRVLALARSKGGAK